MRSCNGDKHYQEIVYSWIYRALEERPELLTKVNNFLNPPLNNNYTYTDGERYEYFLFNS